MARLNELRSIILLLLLCNVYYLEGFSINWVERAMKEAIFNRIRAVGGLNFSSTLVPEATVPRKFACLFVFDKEASADLRNDSELANEYANRLAALASKYTAHANIIITNAGVEMWSEGDQISFAIDKDAYSLPIQGFLPRFQSYLENTKKQLFGTVYSVGILLSHKGPSIVSGGYSQGPANTTSGASIINYRQYPWSIAGLLAHELAHTLSVVHPFELEYICQDCPQLPFCPSGTSKSIPDECKCSSSAYPPEQCLMTFQFGRAQVNAPRYTSCDIQMMNFFSSNNCHRK